MCGRYYITEETKTELERLVNNLEKRIRGGIPVGDVMPSATAPVIKAEQQELSITSLRWGYHTSFSKNLIINARVETAREKKMFAGSLEQRRCIIPAAGFYEWDAEKNKFQFREKSSNLMYMAGLYRREDEDEHFVILTTGANASMEQIHPRMPLILKENQMKDWLLDSSVANELLHVVPPELDRYTENEQIRLEFF